MNTLEYILQKYSLDDAGTSPIGINISRNELAELLSELQFKKLAEVGVEKGIFSEVIAKANPDAMLFSIDPWEAHKEYREHTTQSKIDGFYEEAKARLAPYSVQIIRDFSENAVYTFADEALDFVYIDGNHTIGQVTFDITNWLPKVKVGGILAGHDYVKFGGKYGEVNKAKDAVDQYVRQNDIDPWFVLRDPGERPSWMWVRGK